MSDFIIYQGKVAIGLAVFYMFYRLILSKETLHRFNRIVLLGTAALAFILPICIISVQKIQTVQREENTFNQIPTEIPAITETSEIPEAIEVVEEKTPESSTPWWPTALMIVFGMGAVAVGANTVISIIKVRKIIGSGRHDKLESGEILVITENGTAPFSWMKYIVLSREDYESGYTQILVHEKAHIALGHSWDLLFVDLATILQWFNPAIWMMKADLRSLHEFEADDAVLRSGANIKEYQYLLIRKAVSKSGYSVANSFNHSTLKARITMMLNKKSSRMSAWKALYVIPLVGISLAATAETKVDYQYEGQEPLKEVNAAQDTTIRKVSENWQNEMSSFTKKNLREGRFIVDTEKNEFTLIYFDTEGKELRVHYTGVNLNQDIHLHNGAIVSKEMALEAAKNDPDGVMIVAYLKDNHRIHAAVTTSGNYLTGTIKPLEINLTEVESNPEAAHYCDDSVIIKGNQENIVYVINGERMPEGFDLNTIDQETISSIEVLKTEDALKEYNTDYGVIKITTGEKKAVQSKKAVPFQQVDQKPGFNGGDANEFSKWIGQNLKYPEKCRQSKVEGRVTLQFTVTETGKVTDVKVLRSVNEDLDKEAVRVVSQSPDWTPGRDKNGEAVSVTYVFPVIFKYPGSGN